MKGRHQKFDAGLPFLWGNMEYRSFLSNIYKNREKASFYKL